jgi:hypothetical protein
VSSNPPKFVNLSVVQRVPFCIVMVKLYFMHREFSGHCWAVDELLENEEFRGSLLFEDSWYFLHYCFFGRECICSETSAALQTHLYNLVSVLYRDFEALARSQALDAERLSVIIAELVEMAEYSAEFPVCLWAYGDETTRDFLQEWMAPLPSPEQITHFLSLPHMTRHDRERLPYRHSEPKMALKRYRNELAAFNRRQKLAAKNDQRDRTSA